MAILAGPNVMTEVNKIQGLRIEIIKPTEGELFFEPWYGKDEWFGAIFDAVFVTYRQGAHEKQFYRLTKTQYNRDLLNARIAMLSNTAAMKVRSGKWDSLAIETSYAKIAQGGNNQNFKFLLKESW